LAVYWQCFRGARYFSSGMMRRPWRGKDLDSHTNIIVTKAELQGLVIMGSDSFSQSESADGFARLQNRIGFSEKGSLQIVSSINT
jgi:hypothetical protein